MKAAVTILVSCVGLLLALGMVMLYSASMYEGGAKPLGKQLIWCTLGLAGCIALACSDYRNLKKISWVTLAVVVLLLVAVLIPGVSHQIKGARRWLGFGFFGIQPSELAKIALVLCLAHYGERYQRQMPTFFRGLLVPCAMVGVILGLIFVEPDRGCTILLGTVALILLILAGVRWFYLVPPALIAAAALAYSLNHDTMRKGRIYSWLHPEETKLSQGRQTYQAMIALGSGGWTGLGLGNGRQKYGWVPEQHTDFILSVIGEELGLVATLALILVFVAFVLSGIYISARARDTFGLLLGSGVTFLIGLQAFINIGVVTGALPNKGMPLPFISYGGSNLLTVLFCVGILLSISRYATEVQSVKVIRTNHNPFAESPS